MSLGLPEYLTLFANVNKRFALSGLLNRSNLSAWSVFLFYAGMSLSGVALCLTLTGCAAPLIALGSTATTAAGSAGTVAASAAVANPSTAASLLSTATTGKSPLEHAASAATKQDCNFLNALGPKPICRDVPIPLVKDLSESYPGPADIQTPKLTPK
jgi:hypothetical protein